MCKKKKKKNSKFKTKNELFKVQERKINSMQSLGTKTTFLLKKNTCL